MSAAATLDPAAAGHAMHDPGRDTFVDFRNVFLAYDNSDAFAVEDITLQTKPGEFIAIVGPSGCGKSTFMKLATGLKAPTRGTVRIGGEPVRGPLKFVGMAFQAPTLLPWRTTLDNVLLPLEIVEPYRGTWKRDREQYVARALALLRTVGLDGYAHKYPWELSGGMQQRASICRALIHEPKMLLLDEPFGALDAFTREELWCVLRDLWTERRFNVILVTHDLREAAFLADTIYVMSKRPGRIVARRENPLPRPRDLDTTYTEPFSALVHELREHIGRVRST
jgi:NitT/TauT family transport system ATP-binding protein